MRPLISRRAWRRLGAGHLIACAIVAATPIAARAQAGTPPDSGLAGFEARRQLGHGRFFDAAELDRNTNRTLPDLLRATPGLDIGTPPLCAPDGVRRYNCVASSKTKVALAPGGEMCLVQVVVDGEVVAHGGRVARMDVASDPDHSWPNAFDLNSLKVSELAAIEVYSRPLDIPAEYRKLGTQCGLMLFWTRG